MVGIGWGILAGVVLESESVSGRPVSLDGWAFCGELLSAVSWDTAVVVGDLLAGAGGV